MPARSKHSILSSQAGYGTTAIKHSFNYLYYACDAPCNQKGFFFYKNIKNAFLFLKYYLALSISIINSVVVASVHSYSFFFFTHFYIQMRSFKGILIC